MLGKLLGFVLTRRQAYRLVALHALVTKQGPNGQPKWMIGQATELADELLAREAREDYAPPAGLPQAELAEGK